MPGAPKDPRPRPLAGETSELLRALGHEVGNLLAAIRLSAHLLGAGEAGGETPADIEELARPSGDARALLDEAARGRQLSDRAVCQLVGVARTIADLAGSGTVEAGHLAEALAYRPGAT